MTGGSSRLTFGSVLVALVLVGLMASCTEDPLALSREDAPGATTETVDFTMLVSDLPTWRDTTLTGFALPNNASFSLISNDGILNARTLGRFNVPDTIRTIVDTLPVDRFDSVNFRIRLDTARSEFSGFPITLRIVSLAQPFEAGTVSWLEAETGRAWATAGGDLGTEIAAGTLEAADDTLFMAVTVSGDSLMKAWQDSDGGNGIALVVEGPATRIRAQQFLLRYRPTLQGRTVPVSQNQTAAPRTFITDPPLPPAGSNLRIGGLPAARFYFDFRPPESVNGIPLLGATVSHAELIFQPLAAPPDPFANEVPLATRQISLLGDPFVFGSKTPVGTASLVASSLSADSLATGRPLSMDITLLVARAIQDSLSTIRIGLRSDPDAQAFGFWEFGSAESPAAMRPQFRIILSRPPTFGVP